MSIQREAEDIQAKEGQRVFPASLGMSRLIMLDLAERSRRNKTVSTQEVRANSSTKRSGSESSQLRPRCILTLADTRKRHLDLAT